MKHAFYLFDSDNKGFLNLDDLKKLIHPGNGADDPDQLTKEDVLEMMEEGDKDGDGKITLDDFLRIMKKTVKNSKEKSVLEYCGDLFPFFYYNSAFGSENDDEQL